MIQFSKEINMISLFRYHAKLLIHQKSSCNNKVVEESSEVAYVPVGQYYFFTDSRFARIAVSGDDTEFLKKRSRSADGRKSRGTQKQGVRGGWETPGGSWPVNSKHLSFFKKNTAASLGQLHTYHIYIYIYIYIYIFDLGLDKIIL